MSKGKIAVLIPEIYDALDREFLSGVQNAAKELSYDTIVFTGISSAPADTYTSGENNIYELPFLCDIAGMIFVSNRFHDSSLKKQLLHHMTHLTIPCVCIEESCENIPGVYLKQEALIYQITEHLICTHHYTDLLCLTGPKNNPEAEERARGFLRALHDHHIPVKDRVLYGDFWRSAPTELADEIISGRRSRPEAVVCTNDVMALTLCQALQEHGIRIPEDIAITGYDGGLYSLLTTPAITTIVGGNYCLGLLAVKNIAEQLGELHMLEEALPSLRLGGSCGCENAAEERATLLKHTDALIRRRLNRKPMMLSNHIAKMSDCESLSSFASILSSLNYAMPDCRGMNICLCEEWNLEAPNYRTKGFSEQMCLIYSDSQPWQLQFPLKQLLPQLEQPHSPQFWVVTSLHYFGKIQGYVASSYESAEQFSVDDHYVGWCDAVANGLDIITRKQQTAYLWQKLEEKNLTDIYTGLLNPKGFLSKLKPSDSVLLISFPESCKKYSYFIPIVSAVLRSEKQPAQIATNLDTVTFGLVTAGNTSANILQKILASMAELGIYISAEELSVFSETVPASGGSEEWLQGIYKSLKEQRKQKHPETYHEVFLTLRREIKYAPQTSWSVSSAASRTGLSGSHFQRLYKKFFGIAFMEDLITFRMQRAGYLLHNTSLPINQISQECGYATPAHFMRQFKLHYGVSAGEYRKHIPS